MNTLNVGTRIIKPDIVLNNSYINEDPGTGNMEMTYNFIIHFNFEQVVNRQDITVWQYNYICINEPLTYNGMLSALVKLKYNDEKALAIVLNYNNPYEEDDKQQEHAAEYEALQQWRATAKSIAKEALDFVIANQLSVI